MTTDVRFPEDKENHQNTLSEGRNGLITTTGVSVRAEKYANGEYRTAYVQLAAITSRGKIARGDITFPLDQAEAVAKAIVAAAKSARRAK